MLRRIVTVALILAALFAGPQSRAARAAPLRPFGATITVDTLNDSNSRDGELSLREAIRIGSGDLTTCLTEHEKNQVSGGVFVPIGVPFCGLGALDPPRYNLNVVTPGVGWGHEDDIVFSTGQGTINLGSALPILEHDDDINGSAGGGKVTLNGGGLTGNGLSIDYTNCLCGTAGNQIRYLGIRNFTGDGIALIDAPASGMVFQGLDIYQNSGIGINLGTGAYSTQIGGTGAGEGNAIYANGSHGILINNSGASGGGSHNIVIEGNYIGLKGPSDTADSGNGGHGIWLYYTNGARVGGDSTASRNFVAGNNIDGLKLDGAGADSNTVFNNYIGLTAGGSVVRGNTASGVSILGGASNQIGAASKGNIIVGNAIGVYVNGAGADDNLIAANHIGVNGLTAMGNGDGIQILGGAKRTVVGGTGSAGNRIGRNTGYGIVVDGAGTDGTRIEGNTVGASGGTALPNNIGIRVNNGAKDTVIGGSAINTGNYVGGNSSHGVVVEGSGTANTRILGNGIGNSGGFLPSYALNGGDGIQVLSPAASTVISANLISNNAGHGIRISGDAATGNQILNNYIGRMTTGSPPFVIAYTNGIDGVRLDSGADNNQIGLPLLGNTLSGNGNDGVALRDAGTVNNRVYANIIGLAPDLLSKRGNASSGVAIVSGARLNDIGGSYTLSQSNIIAGNDWAGVYVEGISNTVTSNWIGTTPASTTTLGNGGAGVLLNGGARNTIGLTVSLFLGNVIGGNAGPGIDISGDGADNNLIYGNRIGADLIGVLAIPNGMGIKVAGGPDNNQIGGGIPNLANLISGNTSHGVGIYNTGTTGNRIWGNQIGTQSTGSAALGNGGEGVVIQEGATFNVVDGNLISSNGGNGVWLSDAGTNNNEVVRNTIGLDTAGISRLGNALNAVIVRNGAQNNWIGRQGQGNTLSGNGQDGARIDGAGTQGNYVLSNTIGTNIIGAAAISNAGNGVRISNGASSNYVGWDIVNPVGNLISGNANDGVNISGASTTGNAVYANVIGLNRSQTGKVGNGASGVALLAGARNNIIGFPLGAGSGGNIIAGNGGAGVFISDAGTSGNLVYANVIGTNRSGAFALGNGGAGLTLYASAVTNTIGGNRLSGLGNIIAGNSGPGIDVNGSGTRNNAILGNIIGANPSTSLAVPNGIGIRLFGGPSSNRIGSTANGDGNVLSGNDSHGIGVYNTGTMSNVIAGNLIGTNLTGTAALPNAQYGIVVQEAASSNVITANLISGNLSHGIHFDSVNTRFNTVIGNKIGTNLAASAAIANGGNGVTLQGGASNNRIGAVFEAAEVNTVSGNALAGVAVIGSTTQNNIVLGNRIGVNAAGVAAIPNGGPGVSLQAAVGTTVCEGDELGWPSFIAGNLGPGVVITGGRNNLVDTGCRIGVGSNLAPLGNGVAARAAGISLTNTVSNTIIPSVVAHNGGAGIAVTGGSFDNYLGPDLVVRNGGIAIDLGADGPTVNDPGDADTGPNGLLNYPVVTARAGTAITGTTCPSCQVTLYEADSSTHLPGASIRMLTVTTASGSGVFSVVLPPQIVARGYPIALQAHLPTFMGANSSEISAWWGTWVPLVRR
jgi:hypothetical protein